MKRTRLIPFVFGVQILKGASAGELPIERPTKFEFLVNLKATKALGVIFSPALLATVDETVE
jgi:putative ABC transport system substrate-binding protein